MNTTDKIKILFLCTGNSCRSQMAEGMANHLKGDIIEAFSAGIAPYMMIDRTVTVMKEIGIDISHHHAKGIDEVFDMKEYDCIITLCDHAKESCPIFPGHPHLIHVGFDDPYALAKSASSEKEALDYYRQVRDQIYDYITNLEHELPCIP